MKKNTIKRNGRVIVLTIVKYESGNALADGSDGKTYIRIGRKPWCEAEIGC